jgi:hypothetical protein
MTATAFIFGYYRLLEFTSKPRGIIEPHSDVAHCFAHCAWWMIPVEAAAEQTEILQLFQRPRELALLQFFSLFGNRIPCNPVAIQVRFKLGRFVLRGFSRCVSGPTRQTRKTLLQGIDERPLRTAFDQPSIAPGSASRFRYAPASFWATMSDLR